MRTSGLLSPVRKKRGMMRADDDDGGHKCDALLLLYLAVPIWYKFPRKLVDVTATFA